MSFVVDSDAWGGAEAYVRHLLRRAAANDVRASLVVAEPVAERLASAVPPSGLAVVPLARHATTAPETAAALRAQAPDVVHVNLVDPASNAAVLRAATAVAPTVATLHLPGVVGGGGGPRPRPPRLQETYARLAAVLAPSAEAAAQARDDLAVPAERVRVVPNGVDLPAVAPGPAGARPPRIGAAGRLTAQKGFDVLLTAAGALARRGHAFEVAVAGVGRDGAELARRGRGLPVTWHGFVADVPAFLGGLDLFCLPSRQEAMPLALLEAMAAGLPCVATDVGAVRSSVGSAAVVVPPADPAALASALGELLADPDRREALGRRARAHAVAHFDAAVMARRTYDVLASAVLVAA